MPELPEVETYVRELAPQLQERRITGAQVFWPRIVAQPDVPVFIDLINDRRFERFERRGKYMVFGLDSGEWLIVHLRMTGELRVQPSHVEPDKHTHLLFDLDNGQRLHYRDMRKFGRIWLVDDAEEVLYKLGPEPLGAEFSEDYLAETLSRRSASIKSLLLNQSVLAGVGNIYADEALFLAGIDPRRAGGDLNGAEISALRQAVRQVLAQGIAMRGSSLQNYVPPTGEKGHFQEQHQVFRRTGEPCPRCGEPIQRVKLAQRSTHFCPNCQR